MRNPLHGMNVTVVILSHYLPPVPVQQPVRRWEKGTPAAGIAMVCTIVIVILGDVVHPPAVSTALAFAFQAENTSEFALFLLAVGIIAALVMLQRVLLWLLAWLVVHRP